MILLWSLQKVRILGVVRVFSHRFYPISYVDLHGQSFSDRTQRTRHRTEVCPYVTWITKDIHHILFLVIKTIHGWLGWHRCLLSG